MGRGRGRGRGRQWWHDEAAGAGSEAVAHRALAPSHVALALLHYIPPKGEGGKGSVTRLRVGGRREEGGRADVEEMRRAIIDGSPPRHEGRETNKYRVVALGHTGRSMALL